MSNNEIADILERCELFSGLNRDEVEKIAGLGHIETYEAGDSILVQGGFCETLYIIAEGMVVLERAIDLGTREGSAVIGLLGKGRALGCWSTLLGQCHTLLSSAVCRKPTRVVAIEGMALRDMMQTNLALGFKVMERLCWILRDRIHGILGAMENV